MVRLLLVAVVGDRHARDQLHDEVRSAGLGGTGVEDLGDVGVVHQGQGLPLGLEAGDDLPRVHAELDDLQRHLAADRLLLLGHVDDAEASLADSFQQFVAADRLARFCARRRSVQRIDLQLRRFEKTARPRMGRQQPLDAITKLGVVRTSVSQERRAVFRRIDVASGFKEPLFVP